MKHTWSPLDVARELGISTERVRQLDSVLKPIRVGALNVRLYDPTVVAAVKHARAMKRTG